MKEYKTFVKDGNFPFLSEDIHIEDGVVYLINHYDKRHSLHDFELIFPLHMIEEIHVFDIEEEFEIPEFVIKKLEKISDNGRKGLEILKQEYKKFFYDDFLQGETFTSDEERHKYAIGVFWVRKSREAKR